MCDPPCPKQCPEAVYSLGKRGWLVKRANEGNRPFSYTQDLDNFRKEIALMSRISHPNVVRLTAARVLPPGMLIIKACTAF